MIESLIYTVVANDTLGTIAQRYNTNYQTIASDNHISNPNLIYVNDKIKINIKHGNNTENYSSNKINPTYKKRIPHTNHFMYSSTDNNTFSNSYLNHIIKRESNYNIKAYNPKSKAYGIGQLLPSTYNKYGGIKYTYSAQLTQMKQYINDRYGSVSNAYHHHINKGWY